MGTYQSMGGFFTILIEYIKKLTCVLCGVIGTAYLNI